MITIKLQVILMIVMVCYFIMIYHFLRNQLLLLKYSLLWILAGIVLGVMVLCPKSLQWMAELVGIYTDINLLFLLAIGFLLIVVMSLTLIVSKQSITNKTIIQQLALCEKRIRELECENTPGEEK